MDSLLNYLLKKELKEIHGQIWNLYVTHGITVNGRKNEETDMLEALSSEEISKNDKIVLKSLFEVNKRLLELYDNVDKKEEF